MVAREEIGANKSISRRLEWNRIQNYIRLPFGEFILASPTKIPMIMEDDDVFNGT